MNGSGQKTRTPPRTGPRRSWDWAPSSSAADAEKEAAARQETGSIAARAAELAAGSRLSAAARPALRDAATRETSYLKMAFANPYNLSLVAGGIALSVLTLNPLPALLTAGLETIWLVNAPGSRLLRRLLWDKRLAAERAAQEHAARAALLAVLPPAERDRVESLYARRAEIEALAAQNPTFTGELLRGELAKTDRLVDAFVDMALTCARYQRYLAGVDPRALERDVERYAADVRKGPEGDPRTAIAQKNLAIVVKRQERMKDIQGYLGVARGQLDLIENSFQLIADQIVTMQSPRELSGQLDELLEGVETIRESARDTEALLDPAGLGEP